MSDCAWPGGDRSGRCKDDHGGRLGSRCRVRAGGQHCGWKSEARPIHTGTRAADTTEMWLWPPMAGLHCTGRGLLAHSGGSGCATAWHRHLLQPKAGEIPFTCRAGLAAMVEGWLRTLASTRPAEPLCYELTVLDSRCGTRAMRAGGCRDCRRPCMAHMAADTVYHQKVLGHGLGYAAVKRVGTQDRVCGVGRESVVCSG